LAGIYVSVKPEIIRWVLNTIQFDNVTNQVIDSLHKWLSGEKTPTFNQIEDISKKTNIPFGYFFLDKPPVEECPIVDYRTVNSVDLPEPSRNLMDTLDAMTDIQEWMTEYVIENGQDELSFVGCASKHKNVEIISSDIRSRLDLKEEWFLSGSNSSELFRYAKELISDIGVIVMMSGIVGNFNKRKLDVNEFRAFTLVNQYAPLIFINTCDTDNGKLFSLFHELAHIWIGVDSFYNNPINNYSSNGDVEKICNAVAAELLVPVSIFLKQWNKEKGTTFEKVDSIAKFFRCSRFVIARRALDYKKINDRTYDGIIRLLTKQFQQWSEKQNEKKAGGNYYKTLGSRLDHRLVRALASSAKEGRTQYTEVYRLTNTNRQSFEKLLSEVGGMQW